MICTEVSLSYISMLDHNIKATCLITMEERTIDANYLKYIYIYILEVHTNAVVVDVL